MTYDECLQYLYERLPMFQRQGAAAIKKDLTNTIRLLEGLGNPHEQLRSVHIAGTNGKGTSAHALAAILQAAGYKTGLYTSPHLKSFTERIRIDGQEIPPAAVAAFVTNNQKLIESINPSFFEVTVAMAFDYFARMGVDIAIVETGLGGRLDSTNVITPLVSLITMIGYDHADLLGETLPEIAAEKAGIIKENTPVVIGADQPDLLPVFAHAATQKNAPLHTVSEIAVTAGPMLGPVARAFDLQLGKEQISGEVDIVADYFMLNLPGVWKTITLLRDQGFDIYPEAALAGLRNVSASTGLKGRWQVLEQAPTLVADVSHNEAGISALVQQIAAVNYGALHLVMGMVRDKDVGKVLNLLPTAAHFYFTQSGVPRSLPASDLQTLAQSKGLTGSSFTNVNDAIASAKKNAAQNDLIVVCGSTFVVAEIENL